MKTCTKKTITMLFVLASVAVFSLAFGTSVHAKLFTANKSNYTLKCGDTVYPVIRLKVTGAITFRNKSPQIVRQKIAQQFRNGVGALGVTGIKPGTATIALSNSVNNERINLKFKVKKTISSSKKKISVNAGKTKTLKIKYTGKDTIRCESSNTNVATAKWKGDFKKNVIKLQIKAVDKGKATITISTKNTNETLKLKVSVKKTEPYTLFKNYINKYGTTDINGNKVISYQWPESPDSVFTITNNAYTGAIEYCDTYTGLDIHYVKYSVNYPSSSGILEIKYEDKVYTESVKISNLSDSKLTFEYLEIDTSYDPRKVYNDVSQTYLDNTHKTMINNQCNLYKTVLALNISLYFMEHSDTLDFSPSDLGF